MKAAKSAPSKPSQLDLMLAYEQLMQFNQHCVGALELIEAFGQKRLIPRTEYRYFRALLQELRASASQTVIEHIDQQEISSAAKAPKERFKIEKQLFK